MCMQPVCSDVALSQTLLHLSPKTRLPFSSFKQRACQQEALWPSSSNPLQDQEWGTASHPPDPHWLLVYFCFAGVLQCLGTRWLLFLNWCRECLHSYAVFLFFLFLSHKISAVPDLCCIVTQRLIESVGRVFDPVVSSALAVFEQMRFVDWLWTATVCTKQTTGCQRWDCGVSNPYPSLHFLSLFHLRIGKVSTIQSSPVQVHCECAWQQLHAGLTLL